MKISRAEERQSIKDERRIMGREYLAYQAPSDEQIAELVMLRYVRMGLARGEFTMPQLRLHYGGVGGEDTIRRAGRMFGVALLQSAEDREKGTISIPENWQDIFEGFRVKATQRP